MKVTRENLIDYLYENTPLDYTVEIHDLKNEFDVIGVAGGDSIHYRINKETGDIYCK